jgi:ferritin-like metal-binding protein YciE
MRMAKKKSSKNSKKESYTTLHDLFILKLNALLYVENQLVKALPKMAKAATDPHLRDAFSDHHRETKGHVIRLERALQSIGEKPKRVVVEAIQGLVKDADWSAKNVKNREARDAILIAAAQYVEQYEEAGYGTAREWARVMNHVDAEELLSETLKEEETADELLTEIATSGINERANTGGME